MKIKHFYELEKKYNIYEKVYDNFAYWIYVRNSVQQYYIRKADKTLNAHVDVKKRKSERYLILLNKFKNSIGHGIPPISNKDILFWAHPRRIYNGNEYESIYTDLIENKYKKTITIESSYQDKHYKPVPSEHIYYADIAELLIQLKCFWITSFRRKKFRTLIDYFTNEIKSFIDEANVFYHTDVDASKIANNLAYQYYTYKVLHKYFTKVINYVKPKVIIEVVSYSTECMVLNEIAYERGIPTIELQHGLITENHVAYNYATNNRIKQFPQYLFLFSDYWRKNVQYPIDNDKIVGVGFPYLESQTKKYCKNERKDKRKTILFLSSGPLGKEFADIAIFLDKKLDCKKYRIIYKFHPGEYYGARERYPSLYQGNIDVIDNNKVELYYLFSQSDIIISGYNSTTIIEGIYFGVRTLLYQYKLDPDIAKLVEFGVAEVFSDQDELLEMISDTTVNHTENGMNEKRLRIWNENSLNTIVKEISKIADCKLKENI